MTASPSYFLTPQAQADVEEIIDYLLTASVPLETTEQVFDRIYAAFELIASQPGIGRKRPEWTSANVRFWAMTTDPYLISLVGRPVCGARVVRWLSVLSFLHGASLYRHRVSNRTLEKEQSREEHRQERNADVQMV